MQKDYRRRRGGGGGRKASLHIHTWGEEEGREGGRSMLLLLGIIFFLPLRALVQRHRRCGFFCWKKSLSPHFHDAEMAPIYVPFPYRECGGGGNPGMVPLFMRSLFFSIYCMEREIALLPFSPLFWLLPGWCIGIPAATQEEGRKEGRKAFSSLKTHFPTPRLLPFMRRRRRATSGGGHLKWSSWAALLYFGEDANTFSRLIFLKIWL